MTPRRTDVILKRFEQPDEIRDMDKGRFEVVRLGGLTIGRATYEPGWKWSQHVGPALGEKLCEVEHVGLVLAGTAVAAFEDGTVQELTAGSLFHIPPVPHDSWVVGDQPYVSLHLAGADHYAAADASKGARPRERSFLEAGFYGLSVIFAIVAALMGAFVLVFLLIEGTLEVYPLTLGGGALLASGGFWVLSRLARE